MGRFSQSFRFGGGGSVFQKPATPQLTLLRQWLLDHASNTIAQLSIGKLPQSAAPQAQQRKMSRDQLYRYFCDKIMKVRVFRDNSCELYGELKVHVQVLMNQIATRLSPIRSASSCSRTCSMARSTTAI